MPNPIADPLVENVIVDDISDVVRLETTRDGIATVTLNSPERRNAFGTYMIEGLTEACKTLKAADHVRVVFLRGAGGNFCAGADLEWMAQAAELAEADNKADVMTVAVMLRELSEIPAVTVALIEGVALGGGVGLLTACDVAVATPEARFSLPEVKVGLTPSVIAPYVVGAIGPHAARALFVTGRTLDADEALRIGLVHELASDLEAVKARLSAEVMAAAPGAVAEAKREAWEVWRRKVDHGLMEDLAGRVARRRVSEEGVEGVRAFLERRKPGWAP